MAALVVEIQKRIRLVTVERGRLAGIPILVVFGRLDFRKERVPSDSCVNQQLCHLLRRFYGVQP